MQRLRETTKTPPALPAYRLACTAVLLAVCLTGAGCLHLEQSIRLAADGTVNCDLHYSVPLDNVPVLTAAQAAIDKAQGLRRRDRLEQMNCFFNEKLANEYFTQDGLTLEQYRAYSRDRQRHVEIACKAREGRRALGSGRIGDFELTRTPAGDLALRLRPQGEANPPPLSDDRRRELRELCAGLRIVLKIEGPSALVSTTGQKTGERTVEWVFDVDQDPAFLERPPAIEAVFAGAGLDAWGK